MPATLPRRRPHLHADGGSITPLHPGGAVAAEPKEQHRDEIQETCPSSQASEVITEEARGDPYREAPAPEGSPRLRAHHSTIAITIANTFNSTTSSSTTQERWYRGCGSAL